MLVLQSDKREPDTMSGDTSFEYLITLKVLSAERLKDTDRTSKIDPYTVIKFAEGESVEPPVIHASCCYDLLRLWS
jgi:hypothetical protein